MMDWQMSIWRVRKGWIMLGAALLLACQPAAAASEWHDPEAPIRFELTVQRQPSHAGAGFLAAIPDGGLLPARTVVTEVYGADGTRAESYTLWHSEGSYLWIIIADSERRQTSYYAYVKPADRYRLWSPDTGLTPGSILAVDPDTAAMSAAESLARLGRVHERVTVHNHALHPRAAISIGGDPSGRLRPASFYLLTQLVTTDTGNAWIAPMEEGGQTTVLVNGRRVSTRTRNRYWGGTGAEVNIRSGANRLEILQTGPGSGAWDSVLSYLAWRLPGDDIDPPNYARAVSATEVMRSGAVRVRTGTARDGRPLGLIERDQRSVYWFEDEDPLVVHRFEANHRFQSEDTTYTWKFHDGVTVEGPRVAWILRGFTEHQVELITENANGQSRRSIPVYAVTTAQTSLDQRDDRRAFRLAMYTMLEAYPAGHRALAAWDESWWNNLMRTIDLGRGQPLLLSLLGKHRATFERQLERAQRESLEDLFIEMSAPMNAEATLRWIERLRSRERDSQRRDVLTIREAEVLMHYVDDLDRALQLLRPITRRDDETAALALIRVADIALMQDDLEEAVRLYAGVQRDVRRARSTAPSVRAHDAPSRTASAMTPAQRMEQLMKQMGRPLLGGTQAGPARWQMTTMQEVASAETARTFLQQDFYLEARELLRMWERNAPLSKITGDFMVVEASLYRQIQDPPRVYSLMSAFCRSVEASPHMPEAAALLLWALVEVEAPSEQIQEYVELLQRRLEFHPVSEDLERLATRAPGEALLTEEDMADLYESLRVTITEPRPRRPADDEAEETEDDDR